MHLMPCHIPFNTFYYTIQGIHIIYKTSPQTKCMQHKKGFIEFMCHFMASCIGIIINTLEIVCKTINSNTKPRKVEIHSQGQKTLMYGTRMHVGLKAQIHRDKKNTKPQKAEIQSQRHKTLMYWIWMHAWPEAKIHNKDKKNTKWWEVENPFIRTRNPCVEKTS